MLHQPEHAVVVEPMNELYESHGVYIRTVFLSMRRAALIPRVLFLLTLPAILICFETTSCRLCCLEFLRYFLDEIQRTVLVRTLSEARKACVHRRITGSGRENAFHLVERNASVDRIACPGNFLQELGPCCLRARPCASTLLRFAVVPNHLACRRMQFKRSGSAAR